MMGMDTLPPCGNDCDDTNPNINPGKPEVCGDGIDNDCDGLIDCDDPDCQIDNDGDGIFAPPCGNDCDDTNPNINPGKPEVCGDGIDNDCDGLIDCDDPDCDCCESTNFSNGVSSVRFNHRKASKDAALLRLCVDETFAIYWVLALMRCI